MLSTGTVYTHQSLILDEGTCHPLITAVTKSKTCQSYRTVTHGKTQRGQGTLQYWGNNDDLTEALMMSAGIDAIGLTCWCSLEGGLCSHAPVRQAIPVHQGSDKQTPKQLLSPGYKTVKWLITTFPPHTYTAGSNYY